MKITFSEKVLRDDKIIFLDNNIRKKINLRLFLKLFQNLFKITRGHGLKIRNGRIINHRLFIETLI